MVFGCHSLPKSFFSLPVLHVFPQLLSLKLSLSLCFWASTSEYTSFLSSKFLLYLHFRLLITLSTRRTWQTQHFSCSPSVHLQLKHKLCGGQHRIRLFIFWVAGISLGSRICPHGDPRVWVTAGAQNNACCVTGTW